MTYIHFSNCIDEGETAVRNSFEDDSGTCKAHACVEIYATSCNVKYTMEVTRIDRQSSELRSIDRAWHPLRSTKAKYSWDPKNILPRRVKRERTYTLILQFFKNANTPTEIPVYHFDYTRTDLAQHNLNVYIMKMRA